jgi:internalin A
VLLYSLLSLSCQEPQEKSHSTFMFACSLAGSEEQQLTVRAILNSFNETNCEPAWERLRQTKVLYLGNYEESITDISVLEGLNQLEELYLSDSSVTQLKSLSSMTNLRILHLDHAPIVDVTPLSKMTQLEELWLDYSLIESIDPLSKLTSMKRLGLRGTSITTIESLSGLSLLEHLEISKTSVSDLSPLSNSSQLKMIGLRDTNVVDLQPLSGHSSLKIIDLHASQVFSLAPLSGLKQLQALDIGHTLVTTLEPLETSHNIKEFRATQAPLIASHCPQNIPAIQSECARYSETSQSPFYLACTDPDSLDLRTRVTLSELLRFLDTQDCKVAQEILNSSKKIDTTNYTIIDPVLFAEFDHFEELLFDPKWISLENCPITDTSPAVQKFCEPILESMAALDGTEFIQECEASTTLEESLSRTYSNLKLSTKTSDCSSLWNYLSQSSELHLEESGIENLSPLSHLTHLQSLYLDYNEFSDLSPLSGLLKLQILWIDDNSVVDLGPLKELDLFWLSAGDNHIVDISVLQNQKNLRHLWLGGNEITDISPLKGLQHLQKLHLAINKISDISPLEGMVNISSLYLAKNQISDISPLGSLSSLRFLSPGLDYKESPLEVQRWFLTGNPIDPSSCSNTENMPLGVQLICREE